MLVLINCQEDKAYKLTLDTSGERVSVIDTELPYDDFISFIGKIVSTLREYKNVELPSEITTAWY